MPHTLKKPLRPETKYIVFPSGDQRGLSPQSLPSVIRVHAPPPAGTTYSTDSSIVPEYRTASNTIQSRVRREVWLVKIVLWIRNDFSRRSFRVRCRCHR